MPLRAGRLRPSARLASASPWLGAVRRKRRRRPTTGASGPERARSRNTTKLSGAPQQSNQDALDLVAASVIRAMMDGHRPAVWLSDRYSAQQGHAGAQQTCLAHLARDVAYAREASEDPVPWRLELWLRSAFDLAGAITTFASSMLAAKRRALERRLADILEAPTRCDLAHNLQRKFRRARDQLLTFGAFPGAVEVTNNACERALRPAVVQRKVTNGYRAMWAAEGEAAIRTVVDTARLRPGTSPFSTILKTLHA